MAGAVGPCVGKVSPCFDSCGCDESKPCKDGNVSFGWALYPRRVSCLCGGKPVQDDDPDAVAETGYVRDVGECRNGEAGHVEPHPVEGFPDDVE